MIDCDNVTPVDNPVAAGENASRKETPMAKARLYVLTPAGINPDFVSKLKGQAAVVHRHLVAQNGEPKLASEIAEQVEKSGELKTRQDVLRVTLYYIIVFKGQGRVAAVEAEVPAAPESGDAQLREHVEA